MVPTPMASGSAINPHTPIHRFTDNAESRNIHDAAINAKDQSTPGLKPRISGVAGSSQAFTSKYIHGSCVEVPKASPFIPRAVSNRAKRMRLASDVDVASTTEEIQDLPQQNEPVKELDHAEIDEEKQERDQGENQRKNLGRRQKQIDLGISAGRGDNDKTEDADTLPQTTPTSGNHNESLEYKLVAARKIEVLDEIHARQLKEELSEAHDVLSTLDQEFQISQSNNKQTLIRQAAENSRVSNLECALEQQKSVLAEERVVVEDRTNAKTRLRVESKAMKAELQRLQISGIKLQDLLAARKLDLGSIGDIIGIEDREAKDGRQRPEQGLGGGKGRTLERQLLEAEVKDPSIVRALMRLFLQLDTEPKALVPSEGESYAQGSRGFKRKTHH